MKDIKKFIYQIHAINVEKGFWDKERNPGEATALMAGELSECLEAHRGGHFSNYEEYEKTGDYEANIKNSFQEEPADAYIRICDWLGGFYRSHSEDFNAYRERAHMDLETLIGDVGNVGDWISGLSFLLFNARMMDKQGYPLLAIGYYFNVLDGIEWFCKHFEIDLEWHIEHKLEFNKTREKLHGKKY